MEQSNIVKLSKQVRLKHFVLKLSIEEFSKLLYGFVQIDSHVYRRHALARSDFDAFLSEIGPLARADFYNALRA